jgi:hypothetical protein
MPEILANIKMILMKNDYFERTHKDYIDRIMEQNGFTVAYSKPGDENTFYQVWIKK